MWYKEVRQRRRGRRLAAESEKFLAGRFGLRRWGWGKVAPRPAWQVLNPVAHGDRRQLERLAADRSQDCSVSSYLARELLMAADARSVSVESLQRSLLMPAELRLAADPRRPLQPELLWLASALGGRADRTHRRRS